MVEIKYENLNLFSKPFMGVLKNLYNRKQTPLLKYLTTNSANKFSDKFRHLSLGALDVDLKEYSEEELKVLREMISFTPKGKSLISQDNNQSVVYKKFRQTGSIGSILRQLIEFDSKIVKTDIVEDAFGNSYVYDKNNDYYYNPKTNEVVFFSDESIFVSKKSSEYRKVKFTDSQYEELVNDLKAEACSSLVVEEVSGDDIVKYYLEKNYSCKYGKEGGSLFSSCMRSPSNSPAIKFYAKCPNVKMIIVKDGTFILGRAMLFNTNVGWFVDRRYYATDFINNHIVQYAISKKYHYKAQNNYSTNFSVNAYNHLENKYHLVENFLMYINIPSSIDGSHSFPYMDTFDKLYVLDNVISNYYRYHGRGMSYHVKSTSGKASYMDDAIKKPLSGSSIAITSENLPQMLLTEGGLNLIKSDIKLWTDYKSRTLPDCYRVGDHPLNVFSEEEVVEFKKSH